MTGINLPDDATKAHMDESTDDPKLARAELADLVDAFNSLKDEIGSDRLQWNIELPGVAYASATTFTTTDASNCHVGRMVQLVGAATGTVYGRITGVSGSTITVAGVTLSNESLTAWVSVNSARGHSTSTPAYSITSSVSPADWGGAGDGTTDDTAAVRSAIASGFPVDFGDKVWLVTDDVGNSVTYSSTPLIWFGNGAVIKNGSATHFQTLCKVNVEGQICRITGIDFDANRKANRALDIENNAVSMAEENLSSVLLSATRGINAYRADATFSGGEGIRFRGAFSRIELKDGSGAKNCALAAGAGTPGVVGIRGVGILHFDTAAFARHVILNGAVIEDVFSEDPAYEDDQDGLAAFGPHADSGGVPVESMLTVCGGTVFRNCFGRSAKSQMFFNRVGKCSFYRDDGFTSGIGNPEIDFQVSGGVVSDCDFFYKNGQTPSSLVNFSSDETSGGVDYQLSSCVLRDSRVFLDGSTTLPAGVLTFPGSGLLGPVTLSRVDVFGEVEELLEYIINGDGVYNRAVVKECYVDEITADGTTGNRALVRVRASGDEANFEGRVDVHDCVYGGANTAYVIEDRVTGTNAACVSSMRGNVGFVDDATVRFDDNGVKARQALRAPALAGPTGNGIQKVHSATISASATETFAVDANQGALFLFQASNNHDAAAIFAGDGTGTVSIHAGSDVALGATTNPGTGTFNIWMSGTGEVSVENADASTRRVVLIEISAG